MTTAPPPSLHAAPFHTARWTCVGLAKADSDDGRKAFAELCGAHCAPGGVEKEHLVSTLGVTPTVLDATRQNGIESMRGDLLALMQRTGDLFAEAFAHRDDRAVYLSARAKANAQFNKPAPMKKTPAAK